MNNQKYNFFIFIYFIFYFLFIYKFQYLNFPNTYTSTEWLINYQGGFIRRGLLGEILLKLRDVTNLNIKFIFLTTLNIIYFCIIKFYFSLIRNIHINRSIFLFLVSPYFMVYPLIETDILGRKEIFLILNLLIFINFCLDKSFKFQTTFIIVTLTILFLIHEGLIFYFQYFILIYYLNNNSIIGKKKLFLNIVIILIYFLIISFLTVNNLNIPEVSHIISSYPELYFRNLGAFYWIDKDLNFAISKLNEFINYKILIKYFLSYLIIFIPFVFINTKKNFIYYFLICNFINLPIFFIALDWGRFIYISFNLNLILLIYFKIKYQNLECFNFKIFKNKYYFLIVIIFYSLWNVKVTLFENINFLPYKDFFEKLIFIFF